MKTIEFNEEYTFTDKKLFKNKDFLSDKKAIQSYCIACKIIANSISNDDLGVIENTISGMAILLGVSRKTAMRHLKEAEKNGFIKIIKTNKKNVKRYKVTGKCKYL